MKRKLTPAPLQKVAPRIVVADDEPAIRETASFILKQHGFDVLATSSGREALAAVRWFKPQMALLDILMPEGGGPEILAEIRKDETVKDTFVVILTSNLREKDRQWALKEGANAFLIKPFHENEIMALARQAIKRA